MTPENITHLNIKCFHSKQHKMEFALIFDETYEPDARTEQATHAYIDFNLAIRPSENIIIFFIEPEAPTGAQVYAGDDITPAIYHIPPKLYDEIDVYVCPAIFVVSIPMLVQCIERKQINKSVFDTLQDYHTTQGLIVLGIHHES